MNGIYSYESFEKSFSGNICKNFVVPDLGKPKIKICLFFELFFFKKKNLLIKYNVSKQYGNLKTV